MNQLEIKHLRMVSAIAETGNMTRAAENLCLSQSALSQQLKDIESKLGADLFFRARKKMILTPIGRKLLDTARLVTRLMEDTELDIARRVSGDRGELKIGVQCLFCYKWLPQAIHIFQRKFPKVELIIGTAVDLVEELEARKFDLIVTAAPVGDDRFRYVPLFGDTMVCVLPIDHPLRSQQYVGIEDFSRVKLITHAERGKNRLYQALLKPQGIEPKRYLTVDQPQAMLEMVMAGLGIGIFPAWAVREAVRTGRVVSLPITDQGIPVRWHAVSLPSSTVPVFQEEFVRIIGQMKINGEDPPQEAVAELLSVEVE
ncbi:LysR family transcriptional regulator [Desulfopila aestuarii]|uniref:LysR family transcriptional regulator, regulator for metE and metH n=1 Tax=Desulfopila aestuarii DSM 18488 TaxID=1121416 RepID=A0A1M7XVX8_9BACT|nr:LysR family transcriptional regulator [Desulfopila aestuarii]SHO42879.1 LysR family transcriptional regulator, regulator for metE and metH [Desulfopila aestuarii DSM 18488]